MSDISLTASQRSSLISLVDIQQLSDRTQLRLSTGRRVNSASDDAVNFFRSRSLNNRADDFRIRQDDIAQGVQSLQVTIDALDTVDTLLRQLRGIAESTRSQNLTERQRSNSQFQEILRQVRFLVDDSSYQGLNLLNNTSNQLDVRFGVKTQSRLNISGLNLTPRNISNYKQAYLRNFFVTNAFSSLKKLDNKVLSVFGANYSLFNQNLRISTGAFLSGLLNSGTGISGSKVKSTIAGLSSKFSVMAAANKSQLFLKANVHSVVAKTGFSRLADRNSTLLANFAYSLIKNRTDHLFSDVIFGRMNSQLHVSGLLGTTLNQSFSNLGSANSNVSEINNVVQHIDSAISRVRSQAAELGTNNAILQTRANFTATYVNSLQGGSDNLVLADLNEEGANIVVLQTRQQLAINSLSIAGRQQQSILQLIR